MHVFFIEKSMTKEKLLAMPADDYMNAEQHAFFEKLLQDMKVEHHERIEQNRIAIESLDTPADPADAASVEEERTWLVNAIDRDQRMLPQLDGVDQPGALFFNRSGVGRVGRGVQAFNGDTVLFNALVVFHFHVLQQLLKKSVLFGIHVVIRRHGQQLFLCH
jgi:hypothetical protein